MRAALRKYGDEMRKEGFDYQHPDDVEADIQKRLTAITGGKTVPVEMMTLDQQAALKKLQDDERRVAVVSFRLQMEIFEPVEDQIEKELFSRRDN
jgi:hypothetical protein